MGLFDILNANDPQTINKLGLINALFSAGSGMQRQGGTVGGGMQTGLGSLMAWNQAAQAQELYRQKIAEGKREQDYNADLKKLPTTRDVPKFTTVPGIPGDADYTPLADVTTEKQPVPVKERLSRMLQVASDHGRTNDISNIVRASRMLGDAEEGGKNNDVIYHPTTGMPIAVRVTDSLSGNSHIVKLDQGLTEYQEMLGGLRSRDIDYKENKQKQDYGVKTNLDLAGDKEYLRQTLRNLPKMKREAMQAVNNKKQINRAIELVNKGGVTGKGGQLKAFLAPYAEMIGIPSEGMDEAQTFQLFARAIIGPMRLELVGPGPVSEWEQKLMQQLSGGGGAAKQAAIELLNYYDSLADNKVNDYNDTVANFSDVYPRARTSYRPIGIEPNRPQQPPQGETPFDRANRESQEKYHTRTPQSSVSTVPKRMQGESIEAYMKRTAR